MRTRPAAAAMCGLLLAASLVACGSGGATPATPAAATGSDPTGAPSRNGPGTSEGAPTPGTSLTPAGTPTPAPQLGGVGPSRPVGPPPGRIAAVRRDCGMTAPLSNGRALWIYCDTALFGTDQRLQAFVNTSAAVADPASPTVMLDALDATGFPRPFLHAEGDYPRCAAAEKQSLWPQSAVTIPASASEPRDHVLIWYSNVCLVPGGAATYDIGLAEAWFDVGPGAGVVPSAVAVRTSRLFPKLGSAGGYGTASVLDPPDGTAGGEQFAYVYWCGQDSAPCTIARVAPAQAADASAYRYFDGHAWVPDPSAARPLAMGPSVARIKASVRWVAALNRYVMVDVDSWNLLSVRLAERPEGPWSNAAMAPLPECTQPYPNNCFAAEAQPQLSAAGQVAVSYFDPMRPFGVEPTTRVVEVAVDRDVRAAP